MALGAYMYPYSYIYYAPHRDGVLQEGHNIPPHEGRNGYGIPRNTEAEAESSQARGHSPQPVPVGEENQAVHRGCGESVEPHRLPPIIREQTWEQRFRDLQQELTI